jgi:hypothetical protein
LCTQVFMGAPYNDGKLSVSLCVFVRHFNTASKSWVGISVP